MNPVHKQKDLFVFIILLTLLLIVREYFESVLLDRNINSYTYHIAVGVIANLVLTVFSVYFIKKNNLMTQAGLKGSFMNKPQLLLFPLLYLAGLNALFLDPIVSEVLYPNIIMLLVYVVSVGVAEELSIRGFIQSFLIVNNAKSKKNIFRAVLVSSVIFGLLHLLSFDKGIYGELSQVLFAICIGFMFGALLVVTRRIYLLIIVHSIIDFVAKSDTAGYPVKREITEPMSLENSIITVLLVVPCFIYGWYLLRKNKSKNNGSVS